MRKQFGPLLRTIRSARHLTIKDVAAKAGISSSLLSQIERNRISPSLDTLLHVLEVYGVPPDKFFKDYEIDSTVEIIRHNERQIFERKGFKYETLCGVSQTRGNHSFSAFFFELAAGQQKGDAKDGHLGRELGIVVQGTAKLIYGKREYTLHKGDSVSFFSQIPHVIQNPSKKTFRAYWVVTPADGEDYFGDKLS